MRNRGHPQRPGRGTALFEDNPFPRLWNAFCRAPEAVCPKCGSSYVEYYDPFLSLWRTVSGRRRYRCGSCRFVWRRSRSRPFVDRFLFGH